MTSDPNPATPAAPADAREQAPRHNVLGYLGAGLAVLALVGVATPSILLEFLGGGLLIVALVLSIVAIFRPGPKWPAFVGIGICLAAALTAMVMFVVGFLTAVA